MMTIEFDGDFVEDVFTEYLDETTGRIRPPGTAAARKAVRSRRRKRIVMFASLIFAAIAVPAVAILLSQ